VPQDEAEGVLQKTRSFLENEVKVINRVKAGETIGEILGLDKLEKATIDHTRIYDKPSQSDK